MQPAQFRIRPNGARARVALIGDWTALGIGRAGERLERELSRFEVEGVDTKDLGRFDTAGAFALLQAAKGRLPEGTLQERPQAVHLLKLVDGVDMHAPVQEKKLDPIQRFLVRLGHGTMHVGEEFYSLLNFHGHLLVGGRTYASPIRGGSAGRPGSPWPSAPASTPSRSSRSPPSSSARWWRSWAPTC